MLRRPSNLLSSVHLVFLFLVAFLIVLFSYLILRNYHFRIDLSEGAIYSLSPQTIQILTAFKSEPIRVLAFFRDDSPLKMVLEDLLKEYGYRHGNFHYEFYDPDRMPAKAKQYQIDAYETIVIEAKGKHERTKQVSEEAITNLLARLLRQDTKTIVFANGYGGPSINEKTQKSGYGLLREKLISANYEVKETILSRDGIRKRTDLLVLGGPRIDLLPQELQVIQKYLDRGGSFMVLVDPVDPGEGDNLEQFILDYGVQLGDDVIVDKLSKLFGADYLIPLITEYKPHAITKGFRLTSFLPLARSVRKTHDIVGGSEIVEIAWTGVGSWAETNLKDLKEGKAEFDQKHDRPGPVPIAVAVQRKENKGRLAIFGDSDFVANSYLNLSGNKDLILNTIAWLTGDELAIAIRSRARQIAPLYLKEVDQQFLFYGPVLGFPIISFLTGTGVFLWRRRFH